MINSADSAGLTDEQARRFEELDREVSQSIEGIEAWHRLLDRRTDMKLGLRLSLRPRPRKIRTRQGMRRTG